MTDDPGPEQVQLHWRALEVPGPDGRQWCALRLWCGPVAYELGPVPPDGMAQLLGDLAASVQRAQSNLVVARDVPQMPQGPAMPWTPNGHGG